ncbi:MAG TPA: LuxR C-terminal-related transcriptional regulator [Streptosporangiaceae bacterium]|nr:LuxR C-terminal-related transcriptional regulator [Streptosporangiaceae bacterium]
MTLDGRTLRRALDGLADLYAPGTSEDYPAKVVGLVTSLISASSCSYNEIGPGDHLAWYIEPTDVVDFPDSAALFRHHLPEHPVLIHTQATGDTRARRISDFLSDRQFRGLGLYRDFYRPAGVDYQLGLSIATPDGSFLAIAVNRSSRDFSDDDCELLYLLRGHLGQAHDTMALLGQPPTPHPPAAEAVLADGTVRARGVATDTSMPLLTPRQRRILDLVADGYPDRGIAALLGISTRTVHAHLQHIYRTLDVVSRTEALARVRALGNDGPLSPWSAPA